MGSLVARILGIVSAAALSVAIFGSDVASAEDPYVGKKYSDAVALISRESGTAVIFTVSGDQLETDDCIVTSWQKGKFLNSRGKSNRKNEYYLHLNCNNYVAAAGHSGNSSMSPEGNRAKSDQERAARLNKNPAYCEKSENVAWCESFCNRTGLCEF